MNCNSTAGAPGGVAYYDDGTVAVGAPLSPVQEWTVDPSIRGIGVDFRVQRDNAGAPVANWMPTIYAIRSDFRTVMRITVQKNSTAAIQIPTSIVNIDDTDPAFRYPRIYPFSRPAGAPVPPARLTGFFMDPAGQEALISDLAVSPTLGGTFQSSIYRMWDGTLSLPILRMPVAARSYSK